MRYEIDVTMHARSFMTTEAQEKLKNGKTERRKCIRPRRRLVDLTLRSGTDKREGEKDRRKEGRNEPGKRSVGETEREKRES